MRPPPAFDTHSYNSTTGEFDYTMTAADALFYQAVMADAAGNGGAAISINMEMFCRRGRKGTAPLASLSVSEQAVNRRWSARARRVPTTAEQDAMMVLPTLLKQCTLAPPPPPTSSHTHTQTTRATTRLFRAIPRSTRGGSAST